MKKIVILLFFVFSFQLLNAQCSSFNVTVAVSSNVSCNGGSDGSATAVVVGGLTPYAYSWANGETTVTAYALSAGAHSVTVTDANNCQVVSSVVVTEPPVMLVSVSTFPATCKGVCDGSASIAVSGGIPPYIYIWSNGVNTPSHSPLCAYTYMITVVDANGCWVAENIPISQTNGILPSITVVNDVSCAGLNDGSASAIASGGFPPYGYLWSSGELTQTATMLEAGLHTVSITDSIGCFVKDTVIIVDIGVNFTVSSTNTSCNTPDGTATVSLNTPINNPGFQWSNGANTQTATGLAEGWYSVTVVDVDTGCRTKKLIEVLEDPACVVTIEGYVYNDTAMPDCITDSGTLPFANIILCLSSGPDLFYAQTDSSGYYSFTVEAGTYTVKPHYRHYYIPSCPASQIKTVNAPVLQTTYQVGDFYLNYMPVLDLVTAINSNPARPGFVRNMSVYYKNRGSDTISGTLRLIHDPILTDFDGFGLEDSYIVGIRTVNWSFVDLPPGACKSFPLKFTVPASTPLGTPLRDFSYIEPTIGDVKPWNNQFGRRQNVTGSYDPNDKQNLVGNDLFGGDFYEEDSTFLYQVRFQNTGTDTAFTVVIRDTLDPNLKIGSLDLIDASHPYEIRFVGHNILEFWFEHIMLPDSNVNEPESHGFVLFSLKRNTNLLPGTIIENQAAIYFDFNAPVMTNTVVNTLAILATIGEDIPAEQLLPMTIFPNPAQDAVYLDVTLPQAGNTNITVYDASGKLVSNWFNDHLPKGQQKIELTTNSLSNGPYIVRLQTGNYVGVARIVVLN